MIQGLGCRAITPSVENQMERKKDPSLKLGECSGFFGIKLSILGIPRGHEGWTLWSL